MNQILNYNHNSKSLLNLKNDTNILKFKKFNFIFWLFLILSILFIILLIYIKYNNNKKENFSKELISSYEITTLYNSSNNYSIQKTLSENLNNEEPFVIGLINIDKIGITYPIISSTDEELLKISPCRFYGPMPNTLRKLMYCRA